MFSLLYANPTPSPGLEVLSYLLKNKLTDPFYVFSSLENYLLFFCDSFFMLPFLINLDSSYRIFLQNFLICFRFCFSFTCFISRLLSSGSLILSSRWSALFSMLMCSSCQSLSFSATEFAFVSFLPECFNSFFF